MTDQQAPARPVLGRALSAVGAVIIAVLLARRAQADPAWATTAGIAAAVLWLLTTVLPERVPWTPRWVLLVVLVVLSAPTGAPTEITGLVPGLVALITVIAAAGRPAALAVGLPLLAAALVGVGFLVGGGSTGVLLGCLAGLALAVVVGISRSQARAAEQQSRRLLEQQVLVEQEHARSAALRERSRIARDLHDVLAHSLGGLVLQLDAADALLEADRVPEAATRVKAARGLAADGLDEARRAVDALNEPDDAADLPHAIAELADVHRSLGAGVTLTLAGDPGTLRPAAAGALRRAVQEVLANARRHAPGRETELSVRFGPDTVALHARTPVSDRPPLPGGSGRGLAGLRDRIESAGGAATWALSADAFELDAEVPR